MNVENNIIFRKISSSQPLLDKVISSSIGTPTPEKIDRVLQNYESLGQVLLGAFLSDRLIAVVGFELSEAQAIIKHISVIESFRKQGIGRALIRYMIKSFSITRISLETDEASVNFYKHLGFICKSFEGEYGLRYYCSLDLPQ